MASKIRELLSQAVTWIKKASFPDLFRYITGRKRYYDDLLTRARSFDKLLSVSSSDDGIDVNNGELAPRRLPKGIVDKKEVIKGAKGYVIPLENFKVPNRATIAKNSKLVDELDAAIAEIESTVLRLTSFKDERAKQEIKNLKGYQEELRTVLNATLDILDAISEKHLPDDLASIAAKLFKDINSALPEDSYSSLEFADVSVTSHDTFGGKKNAAIEFTYYLYIDGLDKEQFNIDSFIIVLTGIVHETLLYKEPKRSTLMKTRPVTKAEQALLDQLTQIEKSKKSKLTTAEKNAKMADVRVELEALRAELNAKREAADAAKREANRVETGSYFSMGVYLTSLNKFAAPGHFDIGKEMTGTNVQGIMRSVTAEAMRLISMHSLSPAFNRIRVDLTTQALRHSPITAINGVTDVEENNGDILITLSTNDPRVVQNDIWPDVILALNTVVARRRKGANFIYVLEKTGAKTKMRVSYVKG